MTERAVEVTHIAVIGLGLMGSSLALAARKFHPGIHVTGCDANPDVTGQALKLGIVNEIAGVDELDAGRCQIVFVSTPVSSIAGIVRKLARRVGHPLVVTDTGSTKSAIQTELKGELPPGFCYIGGHPMCGSELEGLDGADPFLYENAVYILTGAQTAPADRLELLKQFLGSLGAMVVEMEPEVHDSIVANTSHLPYLAAVSLVNTFVGNFEGNKGAHMLAAGGFHDTTRIASCPPALWKEICLSNRAPLLKALRQMVTELESLEDAVTSADGERLQKTFTRARNLRASLPPYRKGLLPNAYELIIKAQDRPGFIAEVAGALGKSGINIRDIEVLHVREGEGGTLVVSLSNDADLRKSLAVLEGAGFVARRR